MPGTLMAMARHNRPSIMVYGGTIRPGHSRLSGETLDIVSAFQSYGAGAFGAVAHADYAQAIITLHEEEGGKAMQHFCMAYHVVTSCT